MKLVKVVTQKKADFSKKPFERYKIMGNMFVELYRDAKGVFYRISIPGFTDFVSPKRFKDQEQAKSEGMEHAQRTLKILKH